MVRILGFLACAVAALAFAGIASPAQPAVAQEALCGTELDAVRSAIGQAAFANAGEADRLLAKVDSAEAKLAEGKPADAVAALAGVQVKVTSLLGAPKPKVDEEGGTAILTATAAAVACIEAATGTA